MRGNGAVKSLVGMAVLGLAAYGGYKAVQHFTAKQAIKAAYARGYYARY
jgi:hypothetical protein